MKQFHRGRSCFSLAGSFLIKLSVTSFPVKAKPRALSRWIFRLWTHLWQKTSVRAKAKYLLLYPQSWCIPNTIPLVWQFQTRCMPRFSSASESFHTGKLLCAHGDLSKQAFSKMLSGFFKGFAFDKDSHQLSQKNKCHRTSPLRKKKKNPNHPTLTAQCFRNASTC